MTSLNYLLKKISDIVATHTQINTFASGNRYDWSASSAILYPCLWAIPQGANTDIKGHKIDYRINVFMMDIELADGSNQIEILSDTILMLLDVVAKLENDSNDPDEWELSSIGSFDPFTDTGLDTVSGHTCELVFSCFYAGDICSEILI